MNRIRKLGMVAAASLFYGSVLAAPKAPLSLTVHATPDPVAPGGLVVHTVTVGNPSATTPTADVEAKVNVPQYVQVTQAPGGYCAPHPCRFGSVISYRLGALAPGAATTFSFVSTVDNSAQNPPPANGTVLSADVRVSVAGTEVTKASRVLVKNGALPYGLAVTVGSPRVPAGGELTVTLSFGNTGPAAAPSMLSLALPPGTKFSSASGGGTAKGNTVEWDLGKLPAGVSDRRQVTVKVDGKAATGTLLLAQAELRDAKGKQSVRAGAVGLVAPPSPLAFDIAAAPDSVTPGSPLVFRVDVSNRSPGVPAPPFVMSFAVPESMQVTQAPEGYCAPHPCRFGSVISYNVPALAPGQSLRRNLTALIDNTAANPPPPNGAVLRAGLTTPVFGGGSAASAITVGPAAVPSLAIGEGPNRAPAGGAVRYRLRFGNPTASPLAVVLRVPVPASTKFVEASGEGALVDGAVEWDLGKLAPGFSDFRELTLKVDKGATDGELVLAEAELRESSGRSLVRSRTSTQVTATPPLAVDLTATPSLAAPGATVMFRVDVKNRNGSTPTAPAKLVVAVPERVLVSQAPGGYCAPQPCRHGSLISYNLPSIAPKGTASVQFTTTIDNSAANPPPPNGALLTTRASVDISGTTHSDLIIAVGTSKSVGNGKPKNPPANKEPGKPAEPAAKPEPAPKEPKAVEPKPAPAPAAPSVAPAPAPAPAKPKSNNKSGVTINVSGNVDVKAK